MRSARVWMAGLALGWIAVVAPAGAQDPLGVLQDVGEAVFCCDFEIHERAAPPGRNSCASNLDPYACTFFGGSPGLGSCSEETGNCVARIPTCCQYEWGCSSEPSFGEHPCGSFPGAHEPVHGICNTTTGDCDPVGGLEITSPVRTP